MLVQAGFVNDASVDFFKGMGDQCGFGMVQDVAENLLFPFRLKDVFADMRFYGADILGARKPLTEERRELPVDGVDFISPLLKLTPVIGVIGTAVGHHAVVC
jgi:hypothetical protein